MINNIVGYVAFRDKFWARDWVKIMKGHVSLMALKLLNSYMGSWAHELTWAAMLVTCIRCMRCTFCYGVLEPCSLHACETAAISATCKPTPCQIDLRL